MQTCEDLLYELRTWWKNCQFEQSLKERFRIVFVLHINVAMLMQKRGYGSAEAVAKTKQTERVSIARVHWDSKLTGAKEKPVHSKI